MKLVHILLLTLLFFWFYFNGPHLIAWITGVLILISITAKLIEGTAKIGKAGAKELTKDIETKMQEAQPKPPSKEYLTEIVKETGRQSGQALAPEDYTYKNKNFWKNMGQAAKNFWKGLSRIFRK